MTSNAADSTSPKTAPSHPPIQQMVDEAINALEQRNGSSLFAIKKYITANYDADVHKLDPYIKKYLKKSVVNGKFQQAKGKGASGSFKFSALAKKEQLKAEELAMMKKKKSLSPVKPKTKLNIKTSDKLKASLKSKAVSKPEVDVKAKSMKREKDRGAVAKLLKTDVAKMKAWENGKAKQTNGDVKSPKGKQSKKQHS